MNVKSLDRIRMTAVIAVIIAFSIFAASPAFADSLAQQNQSVYCDSGNKNVTLIWADLNASTISVKPVVSQNHLMTSTDLKSMAESARTTDTKNLAAINGCFFDSYSGVPTIYGTLRAGGQYLKTSGGDIVMGISASGKVKLGTLPLEIRLWRDNGESKWWNIWSLNHTFGQAEELVVYTPIYGSTPVNSATTITVSNGVVTNVINDSAAIPADGFAIATTGGRQITDFAVGDRLRYEILGDADWVDYDTLLAGGPILVENGTIRTDYQAQGYSEAKIVSNKAQRSFIGVTGQNKLFIGTVPSVTMKELAQIAKNLGAVHAMNLDGGASSGLYLNGSYLTSPGRSLASAVIITESSGPVTPSSSTSLPSKPITVTLDSKPLTFDQPAVIQNGRTLVPMRGIFEAMGAEVSWDQASKTVTGKKDGRNIQLTAGSSTAYVDGKAVTLDVPPAVIGGRTLVPVRFISEALDASVDWNAGERTVTILTSAPGSQPSGL